MKVRMVGGPADGQEFDAAGGIGSVVYFPEIVTDLVAGPIQDDTVLVMDRHGVRDTIPSLMEVRKHIYRIRSRQWRTLWAYYEGVAK